MDQLVALWRLQELDQAIARLDEQLKSNPLLLQAAEAREKLGAVSAEHDRAGERLTECQKKLKLRELDLQKAAGSRQALHNRLYGGEVSNVRELEQMEKKLSLLEKEQADIEEEVISLMESGEELRKTRHDLEQQARQDKLELEKKEDLLRAELDITGREILGLQEERAGIAAAVSSQYLERYRILSHRYQGSGLALVVNDICEGCRVFISSAQRGFLYNPGAMVYCENCGRLLVRLAGQNPTKR